jgi:hypothetical protein
VSWGVRGIICTLHRMACMGSDEKCIQKAPRRKCRDWEDNFIRLLKEWVSGLRIGFIWPAVGCREYCNEHVSCIKRRALNGFQ